MHIIKIGRNFAGGSPGGAQSHRKERNVKKKRAGIIMAIVLVGLILYMGCTLVKMSEKISRAETAKEQTQAAVKAQSEENDSMSYAVEHSDDDGVLARLARDKLGLVFPDEKAFRSR